MDRKTSEEDDRFIFEIGVAVALFVIGITLPGKGRVMKAKAKTKQKSTKQSRQPQPFTPGITKAMVRQHAYELYRDKLPEHPLTIQDWVLAEKDLVNSIEAENLAG